jgi:hypothetical protein
MVNLKIDNFSDFIDNPASNTNIMEVPNRTLTSNDVCIGQSQYIKIKYIMNSRLPNKKPYNYDVEVYCVIDDGNITFKLLNSALFEFLCMEKCDICHGNQTHFKIDDIKSILLDWIHENFMMEMTSPSEWSNATC